MTEAQLARTVARQTGESLRTVRRFGFHLQHTDCAALQPEDLYLVVACPRCGDMQPLVRDHHGHAVLGACEPCDLLFDCHPTNIGVAPIPATKLDSPAA